MRNKQGRDIVHRWDKNPIITIDDLAFKCSDICNAGATKFRGEYLLLVTIQSLEGSYAIYPARSPDGRDFKVAARPLLAPNEDGDCAIYEQHGVLDPRITPLEDAYYIAYDAFGPLGYRLGLARTRDFAQIERLGYISEPDTKGGPLFPRKVDGRYVRLERPWEGSSIWVTFSDDLVYWGGSEVILTPRGGHWDANRVGVATPPMEIDAGWLFIYYGVKETSAGPLFRLGAAILDRDDPTRVVGRTNVPMLAPRTSYERIGDVGNLVFSCGAIIEDDGEVKLYYGAANSCICLGATQVGDIVDACRESRKDF